MIRYLIKQPINVWRSLGRLNKIEIIILIGLVYIYLIGRISQLLTNLLKYDSLTPFGLSSLTAHVFVFSLFISGPFILLYLLPRQPTLLPFLTQPLNKREFFQLVGYLYFKYQLITLVFLIPIIGGLLGVNWFLALLSAVDVFIFSLIICFFQIILLIKIRKQFFFLGVQFLILITFYTIYGFSFKFIGQPILFDALVLMISGFLLAKIYNRLPIPESGALFPQTMDWMKKYQTSKINFPNIPQIFPAGIQVLFNKELLGLWRNPSYRRLKIITTLTFLLFLIIISTSQINHKDIWMTLLAGIVIWLHYSNHFNEKYVQPEPEWFFKTVPIRFHQVWISKFLAEFIYITLMISLFWLLLIFIGLNISGQINLAVLLLFFSIFVLSIMLNFQIMFYDDPRLAGYAYHFTIIFLLIMSVNYKLVGPLISIFLLSFYFYKSYRYFKA